MGNDFDKELSKKYCLRFGQIAVGLGFITVERLKEALIEQIDDDLSNRRHRLIGEIMFMKGWMTAGQIEIVLNNMSKVMEEKG